MHLQNYSFFNVQNVDRSRITRLQKQETKSLWDENDISWSLINLDQFSGITNIHKKGGITNFRQKKE